MNGAGAGAAARRLAVAALVALGLAQAAGAVLGSPRLVAVARALCASPLPLVFARRGPFETAARHFELRATTTAGGAWSARDAPGLSARLPGPSARAHGYLGALTFFPLYAEPGRSGVLRFALCRPGTFARELGAPGPLAKAELRTWSARPAAEEVIGTTVECDP